MTTKNPKLITIFVLQTVAIFPCISHDLCSGVTDRLVCDDHNPAVFHICLESKNYPMLCPDNLHFNEDTQKCDWPEKVNCVMDNLAKRSSSGVSSSTTSVQGSFDTASPSYGPKYSSLDVTSSQANSTDNIDDSKKAEDDKLLRKAKFDKDNYTKHLQKQHPSHKFDPYTSAYHRWRLPFEAKYSHNKTPLVSPYKKIVEKFHKPSFTNNFINSREPKYITMYPKSDESNTGISALPEVSFERDSADPVNKQRQLSDYSFESQRNKNDLSFTSKDLINTVPSKDSYTTNSPFKHSTHVSQSSTKAESSNKQNVFFSSTSLKEHTAFPWGKSHGIRRFKPRKTQHLESPYKYSSNFDSVRSSSLDRGASEFSYLKNKKDREIYNQKILSNSKTPSKYSVTDTDKKHAKLLQATKNKNGASGFRKLWWTTSKLSTNSFSDTTQVISSTSSPKKINKWPKVLDTEKKTAYSYLKQRMDQKVQKSPYRRRYKPRHYVPKQSYLSRSPFSNPQSWIPERSPAGSTHKKSFNGPINAPAAKDREKQSTHNINAAASVDRKVESNKSFSLQTIEASKPASHQTPKSEAGSKTKDISAYKSPVEKYSTHKGKCSSLWCKLPACRCVGSDIPGDLQAQDIPQMVMLTFDDSITGQNMHFYRDIFNGSMKNPNGCPIKGTFFISGDNTDFALVKQLHKQGHEIASHTLSHRSPTTWWADAGYENWEQEIVGMQKKLNEKAGVPTQEITGMRAPFLQVGADGQYAMLTENKFRYDSSMVTGHLYANNKPPLWPFTLDTPPDSTTCNISPCPTRSYPGLWEIPLIRWYGSNKMACAMPDACTIDSGSRGSRKFMEENFSRHYTTNRAPMGIFIHASWFSRVDGSFEGLKEFLRSLTGKEDVWVVTMNQVLDWVQHPVRLSALNVLDSWAC